MFETPGPRLFAMPPGVDFARELVDGLRARCDSPEALARVELYVNTTRMARRLREIFDAGPASLLPRIRLVTDLADPLSKASLPAPIPPLRRRLELTNLVAHLLDAEPDLAPRSALFDLSDSLASLMEEMQGEGVPAETVMQLDVADQSGHWQRALRFLGIVQGYFDRDTAPDTAAYTRLALEQRLSRWEINPPDHPVIVAGSTGSRGTTAAFMRAVARLPQGAVILPGFDFAMPPDVWDRLDNPLTGEDHPQYRFARLMHDLGMAATNMQRWTTTEPPAPARNRVLSLALRPAPVTHQWLTEGPELPDLPQAMSGVTLLEAPTARDEATAIALRLRQAAEDGITAALITPDRMLTRQVTSTLDRWGILPDDSAGTPAQLTPPGRFLRHVAALFTRKLDAELLLVLLKHPLTHTGTDRGPHGLNTAALELTIRRKGWPYPQAHRLREWGDKVRRADWADWVADTFCGQASEGTLPLAEWIERHLDLAERIAAGSGSTGSGALWDENAGRTVRTLTDRLRAEAGFGTDMTARDYADLLGALLSREEVRDRDKPHPHIRIWGTLEARVMDADLLILAGLNEGTWPEIPAADPWLNRQMRAKAGLLLPERRIGLSAHDFQQAAGATEVWLSRALKSDDAETVPSRWINRLTNLLNGLPDRSGPRAIDEMRTRGLYWLALARAAETPIPTPPARRPSPAPPVEARPRELPVTAIKTLIRDPYATYVRYVLRLRELDPLMRAPDALMRGILLHDVLETFVKETLADPDRLTAEALAEVSSGIIGDPDTVPFPAIRALWQARLEAVASWFALTERERQARARPHPENFEIKGESRLDLLDFTLTAKADRIDIDEAGNAWLYDYKTGTAPTKAQQESFDKQLLLEAAILARGGFPGLAPRHILRAEFLSLKPGDPKAVEAPLDEFPPDVTWAGFTRLMSAYFDPEKGYSARRALMKDADRADQDHLSRLGEWDVTDPPETERLK